MKEWLAKSMIRDFIKILWIVIIVSLLIPMVVSAETFTVDDDNIANYSSIQVAVYNASSGDIILVQPGIYTEKIDIWTDNLTIRSSGDSENTIVQAVDSEFDIFYIEANEVTIDGLHLRGAEHDGIHLQNSSDCLLINNKFTENGFGLHFNNVSNCLISNNNVSSKYNCSIFFEDCSNNTIFNNYFEGSVEYDDVSHNIWNTTNTTGPNIVGGPYIGGNFWALTEGGGFSQIHADTNGDGFSESSYRLSLTDADYLPLSTLTEEYDLLIAGSTTVHPVADSVARGYENENPGLNLITMGIGSSNGIRSVGLGNIDIGTASRGLKGDEESLYPDLKVYDAGGTAYVLIVNNATAAFNIHRTDLRQAYQDNNIPQNLTNHNITCLIQREGEPDSEHFLASRWLEIWDGGINSSIQEVSTDEEMLHTVETTEGALGFLPFRLANSSDNVSILGIIDDGRSGNIYNFSDINEESIKLGIKEMLEGNFSGEHYIPDLTPSFRLITDGEPDGLEPDYIAYMQSADSIHYFEQAYAYSIYEIDPSSIISSMNIISPQQNQTYSSRYVTLEVNMEELKDIWYNLDGGINSTKVQNTTSFETQVGPIYTEGEHFLNVYAEDANGTVAHSIVNFKIQHPQYIMMADSLGFNDFSARGGTTTSMPLEITNVTNGSIQTMIICLDYDENVLQFRSIDNTAITSEWNCSIGSDNHSMTLVSYNQSDAIPSGYSGILWNLNFEVRGVPGESTELVPMYIDFSNTSNVHGTASAKPGIFTVDTNGTLSGDVNYECNGTEIGNVNVYLLYSGNPVATTTTDLSGNYNFSTVEPGTYTVRFEKPGFYTKEITVKIFTGSDTYAGTVSLVIVGDINHDGENADSADVSMMIDASVGNLAVNSNFDLDGNNDFADAVDVNMMIQANVGDLVLN